MRWRQTFRFGLNYLYNWYQYHSLSEKNIYKYYLLVKARLIHSLASFHLRSYLYHSQIIFVFHYIFWKWWRSFGSGEGKLGANHQMCQLSYITRQVVKQLPEVVLTARMIAWTRPLERVWNISSEYFCSHWICHGSASYQITFLQSWWIFTTIV